MPFNKLSSLCYQQFFANLQHRAARLSTTVTHFHSHADHSCSSKHSHIMTGLSKLSRNGLRVCTESYAGNRTCTLGLFVDAGSRWDGERTAGVAHLLEHIAFSSLGQDVIIEAAKRGAQFSASTSRETNAFYVRLLHKDLDWGVEVLSRLAQNRQFKENILEQAKSEILCEFEEAESNHHQVVMDYLHATAYQGTDLARPVIGDVDSVKRLCVSDLSSFVGQYFKAPKMVFVATGGVSHEDILHLVEKHKLDEVPLAYDEGIIPMRKPVRFTGSEIRDRDDAYPLAHVALAVAGPPAASADTITLLVAACLNASWDRQSGGDLNVASRLVKGWTSSGVVHSHDFFLVSYHDTSLFGVYFSAQRLELDAATEYLQSELMRITAQASATEVQRAKNELRTRLLHQRARGGTQQATDSIGRQVLLYDRPMPLAELLRRIDQISSKDVRDVMEKYVYDKCLAVSSFGPNEALLDYNRMRKNMYLLRN